MGIEESRMSLADMLSINYDDPAIVDYLEKLATDRGATLPEEERSIHTQHIEDAVLNMQYIERISKLRELADLSYCELFDAIDTATRSQL